MGGNVIKAKRNGTAYTILAGKPDGHRTTENRIYTV
jgi:hypothetical protein